MEDNEELNANNLRALQMLDYMVHPVETLAAARFWLENNAPDVILLDVMLPDGDGIDFCAEIRGAPLYSAAHILFLTAKTDHANRVRGLAGGGDDYITKPFHQEELIARAEAAMRRRSMDKKDTQSVEDADDKLRAFAVRYVLTNKEKTVLFHILQNLSIKKMGERIGISSKGVEYHITNILRKTGLKRQRGIHQAYVRWKKE
ncbi:MAG: response regulator [Desulfovibrio sp.]